MHKKGGVDLAIITAFCKAELSVKCIYRVSHNNGLDGAERYIESEGFYELF